MLFPRSFLSCASSSMRPRPRARNARSPRPHSTRKLYEFPAVTKVGEAEITSRSPSALARRGLLELHRAVRQPAPGPPRGGAWRSGHFGDFG
eukprot:8581326-Pyramimonas_sp.AAC.1